MLRSTSIAPTVQRCVTFGSIIPVEKTTLSIFITYIISFICSESETCTLCVVDFLLRALDEVLSVLPCRLAQTLLLSSLSMSLAARCPFPSRDWPQAQQPQLADTLAAEVDDEARRRDAEGEVFREEYAAAAEERRREEAAAAERAAGRDGGAQRRVSEKEDPPPEDDESRRRGAEGAAFAEEYAVGHRQGGVRTDEREGVGAANTRHGQSIEQDAFVRSPDNTERNRNIRAIADLPALREPATAPPTTASPTTLAPSTAAPSTTAPILAVRSSCLPLPPDSKISSAVARAKTPECRSALIDAYCKLQNGTLLPKFQP